MKALILLFTTALPLLAQTARVSTPSEDVDSPAQPVLDFIALPTGRWDKSANLNLEVRDRTLIFQNASGEVGWATVEARTPYTGREIVQIQVDRAARSKVVIQCEWFNADGVFLEGTDVFRGLEGMAVRWRVELKDFVPAKGTPASFRLKFWLEGAGAEARLSEALVGRSISWTVPGTRIVRSYRGNDPIEPDDGLGARGSNTGIVLHLQGETKSAGLSLPQRSPFSSKGSAMIQIADLQSAKVTVQALCWDRSGSFLRAVDLLRGVDRTGPEESLFRDHASDFPAETSQVSFKIWLEGADGSAEIRGLDYAVTP
ncbi:MAG: hypothetical protein JO317_04130 [Verrucomicrobiae bacterium]|nr:hypothetical protein [Verrucomicrobiae bacterium]